MELDADKRPFDKKLLQAQAALRQFGKQLSEVGKGMMTAGAAITGPLLAAAGVFAKMGDQVGKMAKRTGFSVEALSELAFVASQTGTSLEAMETGFRRMQRGIYDAGRGLSTQTDALADLGLKYKDLEGLLPEDQFKRLAEAISRVEDPTRKAALAQALFGRAGTQLLPMMEEGAKGIDDLQAKARQLGLTMSGEDVKSAEDFTDALDILWKVVKMGVFNVGAALAPTLQDFANRVSEVTAGIIHWLKQNRELVATIGKTALVVGGLLLTLGGTVFAIGKVALAGAALIKVIGQIKVAMTALAAHPMMLVAAGLAAVGVAIALVIKRNQDLRYATNDTAKASLSAGDQQRANAIALMKRLSELDGQTSRTADEQNEMTRIVEMLNKEYQGLGLTINDVTGRVENLSEKQREHMEIMRRRARQDLKIAIQEAELNAEATARKQSEYGGASLVWDSLFGDYEAEIEKNQKEADLAYQKLVELRRRLKEIDKEASESALTGGTKAAVNTGAQESAAANKKRQEAMFELAEIQGRNRGKLKDALQREIDAIHEDGLAEAAALEKLISLTDDAEKRAKLRAEKKARMAQIDEDVAAKEKEYAAKEAEEAARAAKDVEDYGRELAARELDARIELADGAERAALEAERATKAVEESLRQERERIAALKGITDEERKKMDDQAKRTAAMGMAAIAREQLLRQAEMSSQNIKQLQSAGTFSAVAVKAGGLATGQARAMDKVAKNTKDMLAALNMVNQSILNRTFPGVTV